MTSQQNTWDGDRDYHARHTRRALGRARCISRSLSHTGTFLDVGCNQGITSEYLLRSGAIHRATGVELAKDAISPELVANPQFHFIQGDICDLELTERYDSIFYGAVHHHIVRERGMGAAIAVLQKLAASCDRHIYFETGHITEGGRWHWQKCLRTHFRTDEEHFHFLLQSLEPWTRDFSVVGKFFIHGVRRWLIRIEILNEDEDRPGASDTMASLGKARQEVRPQTMSQCTLTAGSLLAQEVGNQYWVELPDLFIKLRPAFGHIDRDEFDIGLQVKWDWAVRPIETRRAEGISFPMVKGCTLSKWRSSVADERTTVGDQVRKIFQQSLRTQVSPSDRFLLPVEPKSSLLQVIDLNPDNLVVTASNGDLRVKLVDFERQSNHYLWKNRIHVGRALIGLRRHLIFAVFQWSVGVVSGVGQLVKYQFVDVRRRIIDRQPSLLSLAIAEIRSVLGATIAKLIPALAER